MADAHGPSKSKFLALPVELRQQILRHVLPATVNKKSYMQKSIHGIRWLLGATAILATCKQLYEEGSAILYGENSFIFEIHQRVVLRLYHFDSKLKAPVHEVISAFEALSLSNFALIRSAYIIIDLNEGPWLDRTAVNRPMTGSDLIAGVKSRVQQLVDALNKSEELRQLHIDLRGWGTTSAHCRDVLEPFKDLENIVGTMEFSEMVPSATATQIKELASKGALRKRARRRLSGNVLANG